MRAGQRRGGWGSRLGTVLALLVCQAAVAQQFTFREYGRQDGLSNLDIAALLQDRDGYLWVGTENGLFRYDGTGFERFDDRAGLADTAIRSIVEDGSRRLWVGTSQDLYLREGDRFRPVRPDGRGLSVGPGVRIAAPAPGRLLAIDRGELQELESDEGGRQWHRRAYFTAEQVRAVPGLAHLSSIYVDRLGRIWLGCGDRICSVEGGRLRTWGAELGVPEDTWHSWLLDRQGRLWARGLRHILTLERGAGRWTAHDAPHGTLTAGILNVPLIEDPQGRIVTRSDMGLARWQADRWEELSADNGLTTPEISALLPSRDGAVWIGMSGHGLWRWLGYGNFESWTVRLGRSSNPVWVVLRGPDHAVTLGTRAGCLQIDANSRAARPCGFRGVPPGEIQVMARGTDGSLWLGMATGQILHVAAGTHGARLIGVVAQTRKLFVDSSGRLWICSNDGIRFIRPGSSRIEQVRLPSGLGEIADAAQDSTGALWFASQGGLLRSLDGRWQILELPLAVPDGFAAVAPAAGGWLWAAGASHGLMRLHVHGGSADIAEWIADPKIEHAAVYFTAVDPRGWLWAGTDEGFALFDGRSWRKFGESDGLIWNDTDQNAVFADADGSMWIGTSGGVTHIVAPERLIDASPIRLRIARAALGRTALESGAAARVPWARSLALDLHLSDLDFGAPNGRLLEVRLRGLSDDWFATRDFDLHYPALAPERYTFEAKAVDADHQRVSPVVRLEFEVLPPWWQTAWFRAALGALAAAAVVAAWRWSVRRHERRRLSLERELREREELLERATRDPLTRLWNRQAILDILAREMEAAKRTGASLAVALIDVDHFKRINDTYGHLAGDEVLRTLGAQLSRNVRSRDALGRYGGEELLLVLPEAAPQQPFLSIERLRQLVAETPFSHDGVSIRVTASFGLAWMSKAGEEAEDLLGRADVALYAAKESGRDRVEYAAA